ncbi:MAG: GTPase [Lachnospiraceae bacterium]|nr:GTPase [Lachnospiraceae bacterium]
MSEETLIYLFTGFMDSGKTTMINETLFINGFANECGNFLIICCEDGEEEYDIDKIKSYGADLVTIEEEEDFTTERLQELKDEYDPEAVFIEYNGTWEVAPLFEMEYPDGWQIVQILSPVDATTFEMYMQNMRTLMQEQLFKSDVIVFNRCEDDVPKAKFRANIKNFNRPAQIVYERADGSIDDRPEELPFDINADTIEITDADYALWFMDVMDNFKKYNGKKVHFLAYVYNPKDGKLKKNTFVPGRFAMTCCIEDIQFLGIMAKYDDASSIEHKSWIDITAEIKIEFRKEYKGRGPILYPLEIKPGTPPATKEDELVYFN